jgi:hypothetical protein
MKHDIGRNLDRDLDLDLDLNPPRFPSLSCGFFTDLTQILRVILAFFELKLLSYSYQILDYTCLHSVQDQHAEVVSCGRKSSAFQESVALSNRTFLFSHTHCDLFSTCKHVGALSHADSERIEPQ